MKSKTVKVSLWILVAFSAFLLLRSLHFVRTAENVLPGVSTALPTKHAVASSKSQNTNGLEIADALKQASAQEKKQLTPDFLEKHRKALELAKTKIKQWEITHLKAPKYLNDLQKGNSVNCTWFTLPAFELNEFKDLVRKCEVSEHLNEGTIYSDALAFLGGKRLKEYSLFSILLASGSGAPDFATIYTYKDPKKFFFGDPETGHIILPGENSTELNLESHPEFAIRYGHLFSIKAEESK